MVSPIENEILKLAATVAAEQATNLVCASILRDLLRLRPADQPEAILLLRQQLQESREQPLLATVPGLKEVEQQYATDLYREALEVAHRRLLALLT